MKYLEICVLGVLIGTCVVYQANRSHSAATPPQANSANNWFQQQISTTPDFHFANHKNLVGDIELDLQTLHVPRRDVGRDLDDLKSRANSR